MANALGWWATGSLLSQFKGVTAGREQPDLLETCGQARGSSQTPLTAPDGRRHLARGPEFAASGLKFT